MVTANPRLFIIVSPDPIICLGAFVAAKAENCAESPTTVQPQIIIYGKKKNRGKWIIIGKSKMHVPEINKLIQATDALPNFLDKIPPATHPSDPLAIIKNVYNGICISFV